MGPEVLALAGLIWPSIAQGVKYLFGKDTTGEQETVAAIAATNPEVLPEYIKAINEGNGFRIKWFNRDVTGQVHWFVSSWRAGIRPFVVTVSIMSLAAMFFMTGLETNDELTSVLSFYVSSWMGGRPYEKG